MVSFGDGGVGDGRAGDSGAFGACVIFGRRYVRRVQVTDI